VITNDPLKPSINLSIMGAVEKLVTIRPKRVRLSGPAGEPINASVDIIPEKKYAFEIVEAKAKNGEYIAVSIKEEQRPGGIGYVLTIQNLKKDRGRYMDTIVLKTTSTIRSTIRIRVFGQII